MRSPAYDQFSFLHDEATDRQESPLKLEAAQVPSPAPLTFPPKDLMFPPLCGSTPRTVRRKSMDSVDDSFDGLPPGMSPPRMMSPAAPPRTSAELGLVQLAQSPIKDAAERIKRDLLTDVQKQSGGSRLLLARGGLGPGTESSMSTVPTPPSLSRYIRDEGFDFDDPSLITPLPPDQDSDSSSDEIHNTAYPSEAFLLASQRSSQISDDSDDSMDRSGDLFDQGGGMMPLAQDGFAEDFFEDDSFDGGPVEEETVFGVPPMEREARLRAQQFKMLGTDLFEEIGEQRDARGFMDETPTPWARVSHGSGLAQGERHRQ